MKNDCILNVVSNVLWLSQHFRTQQQANVDETNRSQSASLHSVTKQNSIRNLHPGKLKNISYYT